MANLTSIGVTSGIGSSGTGTVSTLDALISAGVATVIASAGQNPTLITSSAAFLYGAHFYCNAAAACFVKLYNSSVTPTAGATAGMVTIIGVPPGAARDVVFAGMPSSQGIGYTITAGITSTSTTAVAANDIVGHIEYR